MKVTLVSLAPAAAARKAGRPELTPELLAACGARYSRNNEGLDAILAKIDPDDPDGSTDSIFQMLDYGHSSIADMAPVAVFIDGITLFLAYWIWSVCPTASGQESSTRYIQMKPEGLADPKALGVKQEHVEEWSSLMQAAFQGYETALDKFEKQASLMSASGFQIPAGASAKTAERIKRNWAFDRARNMIPMAALTNMCLIMNARGWEELLRHLIAAPWSEANRLHARLRDELKLCIPRMLRHSVNTSYLVGIEGQMRLWRARAMQSPPPDYGNGESWPFLEVFGDVSGVESALYGHLTRHDWIGEALRRIPVRFGWGAICFAELRDLNRHRTGTKITHLSPVGFWLDGVPNRRYLYRDGQAPSPTAAREDRETWGVGERSREMACQRLRDMDPSFVYYMLLGTQVAFEHTTMADKFIYEAELRTGAGAHYRYASHMREVLKLWETKVPSTRGLILTEQEEGR